MLELPCARDAETPLPWFSPLWSYVCGVIASSAATAPPWLGAFDSAGQVVARFGGDGAASSVLRLMLGLLLAGPLLAVAWRASGQIRSSMELAAESANDAPQKLVGYIPYTLPGSASSRFATRLGAVSAWLQQVGPELGMSLLRLGAGTLFSLVVAAELGQRTFAVTAGAILYIYARLLGRRRWAAQRPGGRAQGAAGQLLDHALPIFLTWLIGHATYAAIRAESVLVALCFALVSYGCSQVQRTGDGLLQLLLPQVVVVIYLIIAGQPVTAAGVTLLASSQVLWSPLLEVPAGRTKYFRAVQLPLAIAMLLTAWALGYGA